MATFPSTAATPATLLAAAVLVALVAWWAALLVDDRRRRRRLEPLTAWLSAARVEAARGGTRLLLVVVEGEQAWVLEPRPGPTASPAAAAPAAVGAADEVVRPRATGAAHDAAPSAGTPPGERAQASEACA